MTSSPGRGERPGAVAVRPAVPGDAEALARLNRDDLGYDHPVPDTARQLELALASGREAVLVAELDGAVVGYVHAEEYRVLYAPLLVNVLGIAVDGGVRGLGVGRALMDAVEAWATRRGAAAVRLVSGESRAGAHAFYERLGYTSSKRQLNFRKSLASPRAE